MAMTRLLCCSPNLERREVVEVMEDFAKMMKRSGYSEKFRHEIISDAVKGHEKRIQQEKKNNNNNNNNSCHGEAIMH